jgi:hypothetical protein
MSEYDAAKAVEMADLRDAVIEAARAYMDGLQERDFDGTYIKGRALKHAVEALEAAEGE